MARDGNGTELRALGKQLVALQSRIETMIETGVPQREAMMRKLDALHTDFTEFRAEMKPIPEKVDALQSKVQGHENLKHQALGYAAAAGTVVSVGWAALTSWFK